MPSSAALPPSSAAPPPPSVATVNSETEPELEEDEEYEEIEVEEEVEEEIEEEIEVEDDDEEPEEIVEEVEDDDGEPEEIEESEDEIGEDLSPMAEDHAVEGKRPLMDHLDDHYDSRTLCDGGIVNAEASSTSLSAKEASTSVSLINGVKEGGDSIPFPEEGANEMSLPSGEDIRQTEPRLDHTLTRTRSLSPGVEIREGNKRRAAICDFYAKGWCIKGSTCRFLHVRDQNNVTIQPQEGSVADTNQKSEFQAGEGLRDRTGRSGSAGLPDPATSAVGTNTRIPSRECAESPRWKSESEELQLNKENPSTISSIKDDAESLRHCWYLEKGPSPSNSGSLFHGTFSSPVLSTGAYKSTRVSSYAASLKELDGRRSEFGHDDLTVPLFSSCLNSSLSASQSTTGVLPSNKMSSWTRQFSSFNSSSWNSPEPSGTLKHLDGDRGSRSASLQRCSSPFSGSESEHLSRTNISGDPLCSAGFITKFSSNDWEPSIRFRPSFSITKSLLSSGSQYDPIRDSIEQPNLGDGLSRFSYSSQGTSLTSSHLLRNVDPLSTGTFGAEYSSDKHFLASHQNFRDSTVDKNSYGKDLFTSETENVRISVAEREGKMISAKESRLLSPAHVRGIMQETEVRLDHDYMLQKDGPTHSEMTRDGATQKNEVDFGVNADEDMQRESKGLKHFRAALIDFVKELVKPTWREGHLSKDAHKLIVKKAVDKVLSTVPPHQVPATMESVHMYLSASQPKIAKLVEGYVEKYGKS